MHPQRPARATLRLRCRSPPSADLPPSDPRAADARPDARQRQLALLLRAVAVAVAVGRSARMPCSACCSASRGRSPSARSASPTRSGSDARSSRLDDLRPVGVDRPDRRCVTLVLVGARRGPPAVDRRRRWRSPRCCRPSSSLPFLGGQPGPARPRRSPGSSGSVPSSPASSCRASDAIPAHLTQRARLHGADPRVRPPAHLPAGRSAAG